MQVSNHSESIQTVRLSSLITEGLKPCRLSDRNTEMFWHQKGLIVGGTDEVGRGALAGPVVAAAVILDMNKVLKLSHNKRQLIGDSKKIRPQNRWSCCLMIKSVAVRYGVGVIRESLIDRIGIHQASLAAMNLAVQKLNCPQSLDLLLVDGKFKIPNLEHNAYTQLALARADNQFQVVGAASIIAKVYRDTLMSRLGHIFTDYQKYEFNSHKGYPTAAHLKALACYGASAIHRKSFQPVAQYLK